MTNYEILINKANKCREAAIKSPSETMRAIWLKHANSLEERAANLPLVRKQEAK